MLPGFFIYIWSCLRLDLQAALAQGNLRLPIFLRYWAFQYTMQTKKQNG